MKSLIEKGIRKKNYTKYVKEFNLECKLEEILINDGWIIREYLQTVGRTGLEREEGRKRTIA